MFSSIERRFVMALIVVGALAVANLEATAQSNDKGATTSAQNAEDKKESNNSAVGGDTPATEPTQQDSVEQLVKRVKSSLAVISSGQVGGARRGVGAGFVVAADGLIATNLHVIGEGLPIQVEVADGRKLPVVAVHASDRFLDLALIKVDIQGRPLSPLALATDATQTRDGGDVIVIGNPHGLRNSVVKGVLSARREIEGRPMLQLAIPIEPGNSGGPVIDLQGRVQGVVTMKSTVSDNLGFAMPAAALATLLKNPNPVSYENWRTIGRIDKEDWTPLFGADWRQLGGRIIVRQPGRGFGGRSLLLSNRLPPQTPFEVGVSVKLDDESGAAGLVLHSDGNNRHYGFYPSGGNVRFTCFEGPTVFSWRILHNEPCPHLRPGEFNHFKLRIEEDSIRCFVNHELVFTTSDRELAKGKVGLAKFRQTIAEFRNFEFGREINAKSAPAELLKSLRSQIEGIQGIATLDPSRLASLAKSERLSIEMLRDEAKKLEARATELRRLADEVHVESVIRQMRDVVDDREDFDLLQLALLIAKLDDPTVDVKSYLRSVERMARTVKGRLKENASSEEKLEALNEFLFRENGYHGSRAEYHHPAKRYMHRVIDDRNGLPIMLCTLYIEIGKRIGLPIEGVGLPGHFIVRIQAAKNDEIQLIDVFDGGKIIDRKRAAELAAETQGVTLEDQHLQPVSDRRMAVRMMMNLGNLANQNRDLEALHRYLSATLTIDRRLHAARVDRARVRAMTGRRALAISDLRTLQQDAPEGVDLRQIDQMLEYLENQASQ